MDITAIMAILNASNTAVSGLSQLGQNASDKRLSLEQIALMKEEGAANIGLLEDFLENSMPGIFQQQRGQMDQQLVEMNKQYSDIQKNLMASWGQQSSSIAGMGQEAVAGTSAAAMLNETRREGEYYLGADLTADGTGGLQAMALSNYNLARANMEREFTQTENQLRSNVDILKRAQDYYGKAEVELNKNFWEKIASGAQDLWDQFKAPYETLSDYFRTLGEKG